MAEFEDNETFDDPIIDKWKKEFYDGHREKYWKYHLHGTMDWIDARHRIVKEFYEGGKFFISKSGLELPLETVLQDITTHGHITLVDFSDCGQQDGS